MEMAKGLPPRGKVFKELMSIPDVTSFHSFPAKAFDVEQGKLRRKGRGSRSQAPHYPVVCVVLAK